jgi:predicted Zn-dependent protease
MYPSAKTLLHTFKSQCDWVSLRFVRETTTRVQNRDARHEELQTFDDHGVMMEVVLDGMLAYGATSDLSDDGLKRCFSKTREQAIKLKKLQLTAFEPALRGKEQARIIKLGTHPLQNLKISDVLSYQQSLGQKLKETPHAITSSVANSLIQTSTLYLTSDGGEIEQTTNMVGTDLRVTARKGSVVQSRSQNGYAAHTFQRGAEAFLSLEKDLMTVDRLAREVNELLDAPDCPTGNLDVLIAPDQMMLQIHESIGHPLELDRILGDERNYAGWSFIKPKDFGVLQYGSPLMNVTFNPHLEGEVASYEYDDAGIQAKKVHLIQEGLLVAGLGGSESQKRLGIPGVSNFRAQSWNRPPIDRMANLNLEPGHSKLDEMIKGIERGVYMETNRSWSIDDYRNKFQFGCEYARMIENGKLTHTVKNPNYRGTTVAFWNSLNKVGDASTFEMFGTPHCGKGEPNQVIRVGHASPACLFSQLAVFGGA